MKQIKNVIQALGVVSMLLTAGATNLRTAFILIAIAFICLWTTGSFGGYEVYIYEEEEN